MASGIVGLGLLLWRRKVLLGGTLVSLGKPGLVKGLFEVSTSRLSESFKFFKSFGRLDRLLVGRM